MQESGTRLKLLTNKKCLKTVRFGIAACVVVYVELLLESFTQENFVVTYIQSEGIFLDSLKEINRINY